MDPSKLEDQLKCPVCLEIPTTEIYQCKNGHTICTSCCENLNLCPQCRLPYEVEKTRNRALESILDTMQFECFYKKNGCTTLCKRNELDKHIQNCSYGEKAVKLCEEIGYNCNYIFKIKNISEAIKHFKESHDMLICHEQQASLHLNGFAALASNCTKSVWTPLILNITKEEWNNPVFIVLSLISPEDESISWICLFLDESIKDASKYHLQLHIQSESEEIPHLQWKIPAISCLQAGSILKLAPHRTPISGLITNYLVYGDLNVNLYITKESGNPPPPLNQEPYWLFNIPITGADKNSKQQRHPKPSLNPLFEEITCDSCKLHPVGKSFKCLQCPDYDLCSACMSSGHHRNHIFGLVDNVKKLVLIIKTYASREGWRAILPVENSQRYSENSIAPPRGSFKWSGMCDGCDERPITKTRYKCLQCPDYDLCANCITLGTHSEHIFAVIKNSVQNLTIREFDETRTPIFDQ